MEKKNEISDLIKENKILKSKLKKIEIQQSNSRENKKWALKKGLGIFLGWRLKNSINQLAKEVESKSIKSETIGNVITHILWRLTRIGIIALIIGIMPGIFTFWQSILLKQQNKKIDFQNEKIIQQNELIEGQRRSSYVFLLADVMNNVKLELKDGKRLSKGLLGQILALSQALTPYKFYNKGSINTEFYSPDKGILLMFLLDSGIHKDDISYILENGDFNNLFLENYTFRNDTIQNLSCKNCKLDNIKFEKCSIESIALIESEIESIKIDSSNFNKLDILNKIQNDLNAEIGIPEDSDWNSINRIEITNSTVNNFQTFLFDIQDLRIANSKINDCWLETIDFLQTYKVHFTNSNIERANKIDLRVTSFDFDHVNTKYLDTISIFENHPKMINLEMIMLSFHGSSLTYDDFYKKYEIEKIEFDGYNNLVILHDSISDIFKDNTNYILERVNEDLFIKSDLYDLVNDMSRNYSYFHWIGKYGASEVPYDTQEDEEKLFSSLQHHNLIRKYRFFKLGIED